jgi:hypothetical protein
VAEILAFIVKPLHLSEYTKADRLRATLKLIEVLASTRSHRMSGADTSALSPWIEIFVASTDIM